MLRTSARLYVLAAVLAFGSASSHAALVISELMSSSGSGGTADWFELSNTGASDVDITGYKMDDNSFAAANSVALAGVNSIPVGGSAVFIESTGVPADEVAAFKTFWGGVTATSAVGYYVGTQAGVSLSSSGDGVTVFDAGGVEIPGIRVTFGAATSGSSFDGFGAGAHVSTVGVGGAFISANAVANIGSPGLAVTPEPTTLAALSLGGLLLRRSRA